MIYIRVLTFAFLTCCLPTPATWAETCKQFDEVLGDPEQIKDWLETIEQLKMEADQPKRNAQRRKAVNSIGETQPPRAQVSAPTTSPGDGTSLVDGADHPSALGLAVDSGIFESGDDGKVTLNLNFFSLRMLRREGGDLWYLQQEYEKPVNQRLRRLGLALTLGGKGEEFDRDGDGKNDEALTASGLDDIVTWEFRWRIFGSRDRREKGSWDWALKKSREKVQNAEDKKESLDDVTRKIARQRDRILRLVASHPAFDQARDPENSQCIYLKELAAGIVGSAELSRKLSPDLAELIESLGDFKEDYEKVVRLIDKRPLVSLAFGGTERKTEFGPDKEFIALRGDWPAGNGKSVKLNVDWNRMDSTVAGAEEIETLKAGLEWSALWFKDSKLAGEGSTIFKDGVEASFAATWEMFDNVPDAKHDTQGKLSVKLEFPIAKGVNLPISVTWADHVDLLSDEDEVRGHVGLSWDLSKLFKDEDKEADG